MSTFWRRFLLVLGLLGLAGGCNPILLPFFLTAEEPKFPAEFKGLTDEKDKKKEVKVVVLTYSGVQTSEDLLRADRDLAQLVAKHLQELCKTNGENVKVVNPMKVEEYKNANPDWHGTELEDVGRHFKADAVVYVEIGALSMYQPGSSGMFYQGKANLTVSLVDVHDADGFSTPRELTFTYPSEGRGGNIPVDADTPPQLFKMKFFEYLARRLAWQFTAHPTSQHHWCE